MNLVFFIIGEKGIPASSIGLVVGLLTVAGGVATFMTAGAAAIPIGILAASGTGSGLVSGGLNIWNAKENAKEESELIEEIRRVLIIDAEAVARFDNVCEQVSTTYFSKRNIIFRELHMFAHGFGCVAVLRGVEEALSVLATIIVPLAKIISPETAKLVGLSVIVLNKIITEASETTGKEVAKNVGKKAAKVAGRKAAKDVIKKAGEKAAQEVLVVDVFYFLDRDKIITIKKWIGELTIYKYMRTRKKIYCNFKKPRTVFYCMKSFVS